MGDECSIAECTGDVMARGWCRKHYQRWFKNGDPEALRGYRGNPSHGLKTKFPAEYRSWKHARERCLNPNIKTYHHYGGRGITFCERWNDFALFMEDMGPRPAARYSIGRIDNDGNYEPDNCRWETVKQQANNRRTSRLFKIGFISQTVNQWVDLYGNVVTARLAYRRMTDLGWDTRKAVSTPPRVIAATPS